MNLLDLMGDTPPPTAPATQRRSAPTRPAPPVATSPVRTFIPRAVRPMWRNGRPVSGSDRGYVPHQADDLRWLTHGYDTSGQPMGRWFRWSDSPEGWMWICIDPGDATGINAFPDTPPASIGLPS